MNSYVKFSIQIVWVVFIASIAISVFSQTSQINDTISNSKTEPVARDFQFSIFPYVSINRQTTDDVVNLSFNIFGGYVKEVRSFEIGSIVNIEHDNAGTCQLSGICNLVGGTSNGFQGAGVFNAANSQKGVQAAGVLNLVRNDAGACQLAGVGNITEGSFQGLQSAGVINTAKTINGVQVSGVLNIIDGDAEKCQIAGVGNFTDGNFQGLQTAGVISVAKTVKGSQISGVLNATEKATGAQIAGVANIVPEIKGTQIAGVINVSDKIEGLQLSGCVNRTSFIKGTQISVVNFSDSCVGIPIGVFSYVGNGYRTLELSVDELLFANLAFKSGVNQFYNIFMAGIRPGNFENPIWTFGYGIGTRFGTQNNVHFDLELSAQHISKGHVRNYLSELCRVYFGVEKKISSWSSVSFGLSYNMYLVDTDSPYSETLSSIAPYHFFNSTSPKGYNIKTWLGGRVAFRF